MKEIKGKRQLQKPAANSLPRRTVSGTCINFLGFIARIKLQALQTEYFGDYDYYECYPIITLHNKNQNPARVITSFCEK